MASNTKITKARRKNRDQKLITKRQRGLRKVFKASKEMFDKIFGS
jgi:hypothetical protein